MEQSQGQQAKALSTTALLLAIMVMVLTLSHNNNNKLGRAALGQSAVQVNNMGSAASGTCGSISLPPPAPYSSLGPAPHHPTLARLRSPAIDLSLDLSDGHQGGGRVTQEKSKGPVSLPSV